MYGDHTLIARHLNISPATLSLRLTGKRGIKWDLAKRLAAVTAISPADWMELPAEALVELIDRQASAGLGLLPQLRSAGNTARRQTQGKAASQ